METTSETLRNIFQEIGKGYCFDKVEADLVAFKEFKVRWERSYKWANFHVSDYLADAPAEVIKGLATTLFRKITGDSDEGYSEEMCGWVTAPEFSENKRPIYLKRSRNLTRFALGEVKDLMASYQRLVDFGLIEFDPTAYLTWTKESNVRRIGHCSVLMRAVSISSVLDSEMIPDFVLDYCLYHELCHLKIGFDPTAEKHGENFAELERKYPQRDEAED